MRRQAEIGFRFLEGGEDEERPRAVPRGRPVKALARSSIMSICRLRRREPDGRIRVSLVGTALGVRVGHSLPPGGCSATRRRGRKPAQNRLVNENDSFA